MMRAGRIDRELDGDDTTREALGRFDVVRRKHVQAVGPAVGVALVRVREAEVRGGVDDGRDSRGKGVRIRGQIDRGGVGGIQRIVRIPDLWRQERVGLADREVELAGRGTEAVASLTVNERGHAGERDDNDESWAHRP